MLQEFLRRGKKWANKPDSNFREGASVELGNSLRAGLGFSLRWKLFQKVAMEVVDFSVDFCGGFSWRKIQKKNPPKKSASRKQKIRRRTTPPKSTSQAQKSAVKPTNKSACRTSKYTPGFCSIEKACSWWVFRTWILGHSLAAFWAWSRLPCCNAPAIPQLLVKNSPFEKTAQK